MVAYSFKRRFETPILAGTKRQTIRGDRNRHARPGETLQLYTGMRTKHCRLLGRAACIGVWPVTLYLGAAGAAFVDGADFAALYGDLDGFARADGFADWSALVAFWTENHPGADRFSGVLIRWGELHG